MRFPIVSLAKKEHEILNFVLIFNVHIVVNCQLTEFCLVFLLYLSLTLGILIDFRCYDTLGVLLSHLKSLALWLKGLV